MTIYTTLLSMAWDMWVIERYLDVNGILEKLAKDSWFWNFIFYRIFFALMFLLVVLFSIYFISSIWIKWSASPIIITLSSMPKSIKDIPFPAITVCNMNQVRKNMVLKIPKNSSEFSVIKSLCRSDPSLDNSTPPDYGTGLLYRRVLLTVSVFDQNNSMNFFT